MTTTASVVQLSAQQKKRHNENPAVSFGGCTSQLAEAASFRARKKAAEGMDVSPERPVGIQGTAAVLSRAGTLVGSQLTRQNTDREAFAMLQQVRRQQDARKRGRTRLIDPRTSRIMPYWDTLTAVAIVFTAFVTPFEVAYLPMPTSAADFLFVLNRLIDVVFVVDLAVTFRLIYAKDEDGDEGILWVDDPWRIAAHYARGWLLIDAVSIGVSAVDYVGLGSADAGDDGHVTSLRALRALRSLRLIKLARLFRASRIFKRWEAKFAINYTALELSKCLLAMFIVAHWFGCLWTLQASLLSTSVLDSWLGTNGYCEPLPLPPSPAAGVASPCPVGRSCHAEPGVACRDEGTIYSASVYWAVMTITSIGYGDIGATPLNPEEQAACTILMILGAILWGYVIGTFCGTIANLSPATQEFRRNMDDLNTYMRSNRVDAALRSRLREYFHRTRHLHDAQNQKRLIGLMSPGLQSELILSTNQRWLRSVWFLANDAVEAEFVVGLTLEFSAMVLAPFELAPYSFLYILYRGVVTLGGELRTRGSTWGEDVILESCAPGLRRVMNAKAMNYAEVYLINWASLSAMIAAFPASGEHIRRCALRLAMRRQIQRVAAAHKRAELRAKRAAAAVANGDARTSAEPQDKASAISPDDGLSFGRAKSVGRMLYRSTDARQAEVSLQTQLIHARRASSQQLAQAGSAEPGPTSLSFSSGLTAAIGGPPAAADLSAPPAVGLRREKSKGSALADESSAPLHGEAAMRAIMDTLARQAAAIEAVAADVRALRESSPQPSSPSRLSA